MFKLPVYLDNNATTVVDKDVLKNMLPYFETYYGNAGSNNHSFGWEANEAVEFARIQVGRTIGCEPVEIIFTGGATESINLAIKGVYEAYSIKGNHIITCTTEHKAVLACCQHLENSGAEISYLKPDENGRIDLEILEKLINPKTILICLMYANNETGMIHPVKEIGAIAKKHGIIFFSDATQAVGKMEVNVLEDNIDLLAFNAHKIYGPKGVGALYVRRKNPRVRLKTQIDGGGQERGLRSGTLNVPGIVGLGEAIEICRLQLKEESQRLSALRDKLENNLLALNGCRRNGSQQNRLPHVSNLSFDGLNGQRLLSEINKTIAVSSGSACTSVLPEPSHVLTAMGRSVQQAKAAVRFSLGRFTTEEEIDYTIEKVKEIVSILQEDEQNRTLLLNENADA